MAELARRRWLDATGEVIPPLGEETGDPWPDGVEPDLFDASVGIARTEPRWRGREGARECERLHLDAIAAAKRLIYLENQYVTSPVIAAALAERLTTPEGPEIVIVSTAKSPSWFDRAAMDRAREVLLHRLRQADRYGRFSAWAPLTEGGRGVIVHSKVSLIDDRLLRIGSANLNNRSNGFDTECDVAVEAERPGDAACDLIRRLRARLLGHFLGVDAGDFERAYGQLGSVSATIEALNRGRRLQAARAGGAARRVAADRALAARRSLLDRRTPGGRGGGERSGGGCRRWRRRPRLQERHDDGRGRSRPSGGSARSPPPACWSGRSARPRRSGRSRARCCSSCSASCRWTRRRPP